MDSFLDMPMGNVCHSGNWGVMQQDGDVVGMGITRLEESLTRHPGDIHITLTMAKLVLRRYAIAAHTTDSDDDDESEEDDRQSSADEDCAVGSALAFLTQKGP